MSTRHFDDMVCHLMKREMLVVTSYSLRSEITVRHLV
jgi:hypothetical protein